MKLKKTLEWTNSSIRKQPDLAHLAREGHGDGLDFGVGLEAILPELATGSRLLEASERGRGAEDVVAVQPKSNKTHIASNEHDNCFN